MVKTKYRHIRGDFTLTQPISDSSPSPYESNNIKSQLPIKWDKAIDFTVYDKDGNKWIDLTSGIFVANTGHSNPDVAEAIKK
jgi:4-aminobutyrate aminotransferase/diaminobutyrate-pyruvate transaminase/4-aminobutyrate aminotransferase/(S)-3-amino-2-methylpropionate transaminase